MPDFYHGTRRVDAVAMTGVAESGGIDVSRGSGEFGQGFYTQDSRSNALTWVQHRFPASQNPCLLEVTIPEAHYDGLSRRSLDLKQAKRLESRLRKKGTTKTHREGVDVVVGPLNGSNWIEQQKFESTDAQTLLNGLDTRRAVV